MPPFQVALGTTDVRATFAQPVSHLLRHKLQRLVLWSLAQGRGLAEVCSVPETEKKIKKLQITSVIIKPGFTRVFNKTNVLPVMMTKTREKSSQFKLLKTFIGRI